jgi:hypothetical protein
MLAIAGCLPAVRRGHAEQTTAIVWNVPRN